MRVLHLVFQLHEPYGLSFGSEAGDENNFNRDVLGGYFDVKESFTRNNQEVYQPLFALMERNLQKNPKWHFSLMISGMWLELAERYDQNLLERLKKILKSGKVELIFEPYYHSLAFFYNREEFTLHVQQFLDKVGELFDVQGRIMAMPELIYNDEIGKWAEDFGFAGMLVGGALGQMDWRSANHVYEAAECEYLRLLVENRKISEMIARGDVEILGERKSEDGEIRQEFALKRLEKVLDLELLRGGLINIVVDAKVLARQRKNGIIKLFDELIASWTKNEKNGFVNAAEACVVETPTMELAVRETVSRREDVRAERVGLVLKSDLEYQLPGWLSGGEQKALADKMYGMRREVLASENEMIIEDYRRMLAIDMYTQVPELAEKVVMDLRRRVNEVKKSQAVEISRTYTKKRDRGIVGSGVVPVKFSRGNHGVASVVVHETSRQEAQLVPVQRLRLTDGEDRKVVKKVADTGVEVKIEAEAVAKKKPKKMGAIRRVIKKLVIE